MKVVILGGNECMERQYKDICEEYCGKAKIFFKPSGSLKNKLGRPDLMICFTGLSPTKFSKMRRTRSAAAERRWNTPRQHR